MSSWEERMAQRSGGMNAQERTGKGLLWTDLNEDEDYQQRKRAAGFVLVDGKWFKPEPEEGPDYCRECCTWDTQAGAWTVTCFPGGSEGLTCVFSHEHHEGEIWLA